MTSPSPMSITQLVHSEEDSDVKSTAQSLGPFDSKGNKEQHFMHRVSNIPLVNSALRAYESSKASSSVVKYGAEMVESFAAPIYDKVGKRVLSGAVDEWGCKQLDKLEERYPSYVTSPEEQEDATMAAASALARASLTDEYEGGVRRRREDSREDQTYGSRSRSRSASRSTSRSTSPRRPYNLATKTTAIRHRTQPIGKSKWHQIVMHAGSAAGTTAAVVSEESMKCLRYCLSWLQSGIVNNSTSALGAIKKEIIDTLRKVVEVVSRYAGSGLPEQAKASVRGFILALPGRWAILNSNTNGGGIGIHTILDCPTTPATNNNESDVHETSIRLLNFGGESIEMLQSVSNVFADTIERAELWLERLRVVGVAGVSRPEKCGATMETVPEQPNESMDLS
ncbi:transcription factor Opi1-domain-containing protein [Phycomyces blakesleeanus]|uniref:Transcription factor Opi1-domain-containing protein n=1 Tax=Phycomyces blakesleeanus TaxID=4837 RepID=A0ABR3ASG4_PHYBL